MAASLASGQRLYCMLDIQNERNPRAVAVRTSDHRIVGFCPDYLTDELDARLVEDRAAELRVLAMNPSPAPVHYRVSCELRFAAPTGARPFRSSRLERALPAKSTRALVMRLLDAPPEQVAEQLGMRDRDEAERIVRAAIARLRHRFARPREELREGGGEKEEQA